MIIWGGGDNEASRDKVSKNYHRHPLRDKMDDSFFFVQRNADCWVSTGFGDIPRDILPNAKIGDGPKISPV